MEAHRTKRPHFQGGAHPANENKWRDDSDPKSPRTAEERIESTSRRRDGIFYKERRCQGLRNLEFISTLDAGNSSRYSVGGKWLCNVPGQTLQAWIDDAGVDRRAVEFAQYLQSCSYRNHRNPSAGSEVHRSQGVLIRRTVFIVISKLALRALKFAMHAPKRILSVQWLGPPAIWRENSKVGHLHALYTLWQYLTLLAPHQIAFVSRPGAVVRYYAHLGGSVGPKTSNTWR